MSDKSLVFKNENCHSAKLSKERRTVLLSANSNGTDKLRPLVIGKFAKPRRGQRHKIEISKAYGSTLSSMDSEGSQPSVTVLDAMNWIASEWQDLQSKTRENCSR
ncbi:hypothetical protein ANN_26064 [Periplaneta americana]|uniref:DDE-1 domain-containing protein n=1 Tax=Periplaneta americana TaxID=6978 RepID=A0ABQ8S5B4_PERAM|nr:hypothetical protein ANN_26064 [Periplaneta americana]